MPTYEYACKGCGNQFEVVQSFRDDPLEVCESCGAPLRKVFSAAGIIFKGSGYYVTDTRAEGQAASGDKGGPSSNGKAGGSGPAKDSGDKAGAASDAKASGGTSGQAVKKADGSSAA